MSQLTLDPNATTHQGHQTPHDREAEPATSILARGGSVRLGKAGEDFLQFVLYSDASVGYREMKIAGNGGLAIALDREQHLAALGEFDGVADKLSRTWRMRN